MYGRLGVVAWLAAWIVVAASVPLVAQPRGEALEGILLDAAGEPLTAHRVVFRAREGGGTFVSQPSGADGAFLAIAPAGGDYVPLEVVLPTGERVGLPPRLPCKAMSGARCDIRLGPSSVQGEQVVAAAPGERPWVRLGGRVVDSAGTPLAGHRVVFRARGDVAAFVGQASDDEGSYSVNLPDGLVCAPVAVFTPSGRRITLEDESPLQVVAGMTRDVRLDFVAHASSLPAPAYRGADRLFAAFTEDAVVVDGYRVELQFDTEDLDAGDAWFGRVVGAVQVPAIPHVEFGASAGYGELDSALGSAGGAEDIVLSAKLALDADDAARRAAFGFLLELPTGDEDAGIGQDAYGTKLFYAVRQPVSIGTVSWHVGVRLTGDGVVAGVPLEGRLAPAGAAGLIVPLAADFTLIGELNLEGERFDDAGEDVRLSVGFNARMTERFVVRTAVAVGLSDGAPDTQIRTGLAFEF